MSYYLLTLDLEVGATKPQRDLFDQELGKAGWQRVLGVSTAWTCTKLPAVKIGTKEFPLTTPENDVKRAAAAAQIKRWDLAYLESDKDIVVKQDQAP